ncbi:YigZ family protein [Anaerocellum diazotrophicum]|uniref:YigZ family protein n=1 Tax=Caldicellulosiruptor diazotrophicus TaxID=2806205 RepID=A0ABM7NNM0_9FIRM|nr:YigZ family protein [Caldicellulosiruptor diazotrophicus]BCS81700.1 YigZ family protein [Caldicellulosiruptor diazotrophicus]
MGFKTVAQNVRVEFIEKKSKFIASVFKVENQREVNIFLEQVRKEFYDATHNVYAYTYGIEYPVQKYSDDGEPQGTAGLPVMEVIRKSNVSNVLIIVTRYFGGILLGASGLVRAYTQAATLGLEKAGILEYHECEEILLSIEYSDFDKIRWLISRYNAIIEKIEYSQIVDLFLAIKKEEVDEFIKKVSDITSGNFLADRKGTVLRVI